VVLLIVIGVVVYLAQSGSSAITMPNVIGKSADAAESTLESLGIKHISFAVEPSLSPANTVFSTDTKVGVVVRPNQPIYFQISSGPSVMPNLAGLTAQEATRHLGALGLRWAIVRVHRDQSGHVVVGQTPAPGSKLEKQSWVEIDVTSSSTAVPRLMPGVGMMPAQFAIAELRSLGLKLHVRYFTTQVAPPGGWVQGETTPGSPVTSSGFYIAVAEPPVTHGKDSRTTSS
jgi:serine/threonine-protein kinase